MCHVAEHPLMRRPLTAQLAHMHLSWADIFWHLGAVDLLLAVQPRHLEHGTLSGEKRLQHDAHMWDVLGTADQAAVAAPERAHRS